MAFAWSGGPGVRLQHPGGHRPVRLVGLGRQRLRRPRGERQVGGHGPGPSDLSASAPPARPRAAGCTVVCVCVPACVRVLALSLAAVGACLSCLSTCEFVTVCFSLSSSHLAIGQHCTNSDRPSQWLPTGSPGEPPPQKQGLGGVRGGWPWKAPPGNSSCSFRAPPSTRATPSIIPEFTDGSKPAAAARIGST